MRAGQVSTSRSLYKNDLGHALAVNVDRLSVMYKISKMHAFHVLALEKKNGSG